jgi:hypothetical protein
MLDPKTYKYYVNEASCRCHSLIDAEPNRDYNKSRSKTTILAEGSKINYNESEKGKKNIGCD